MKVLGTARVSFDDDIPIERKPPEGSSKKGIFGTCFPNLEGQRCTVSHCANWRIETSRLSAPDGMAQSSCLNQFETAYSVQCLVFHCSAFLLTNTHCHDEFSHGSSQTFLPISLLRTAERPLSPMKTRSKIHELFWEKRLGCGDYRFCKMCWSQEEEEEEVEKVQRLIDAGFSPSTSFLWPVSRERSAPAKPKLRSGSANWHGDTAEQASGQKSGFAFCPC